MTKNVIDINGKRYDTVTGALIGNVESNAARPATASRGQFVDGFRRTSRTARTATAPLKPIPAKAAHTAVAVPAPQPRKIHEPASHVKPHAPQQSKTLMRTAVKKPVIQAPSVIKAQTRTDILARVPQQTIVPKLSHTRVDNRRQRRAERIIQSPAVSKYSQPAASLVQAPVAQAISQKHASKVQPVVPAPAPVRSELRAPRPVHQKPHQTAHQRPAAQMNRNTQPLSHDIFEQALAEADSHERTYARKKRGRLAGMATAACAVLLLVGFLGYQNIELINMKVAASRAGIQARLPEYSPTGFSIGNLTYSSGSVTMDYFAESDPSRTFKISQTASEWNSSALLDNFVTTTSKSYQTIERAGRTIYLYGNNTATWVDNGIWYTVNGNENLTSTQLLDVASSL